eukprot:TRINITY_DN8191_c0_g1_i1.p1 TRINITY_DN8191_c0_g1~~TRINITY_DN8191_c0_g1_i1.p1  ORF type:complete len:320 (-),score=60.48 TRINITY_DN8191_c0_g1_i1:74-1033(-)
MGMNNFDTALVHFETALRLQPNKFHTHYHLGQLYISWGDPIKAIPYFETAISLSPNFAGSYSALASSMQAFGSKYYKDSLELYKKSVNLDPRNHETYSNIGILLKNMGNFQDSFEAFEKSLSLRASTKTEINYAHALEENKEYKRALQIYSDVFNENSNSSVVCELFLLEQRICEWSNWESHLQLMKKQIEFSLKEGKIPCITPAMGLFSPFSLSEDLQIAQITSNKIAQHKHQYTTWNVDFDNPRIKLGYISSYLKNHIVADLVAEIIRLHDKEKFEVFVYAPSLDESILSNVDHFIGTLTTLSNSWLRKFTRIKYKF